MEETADTQEMYAWLGSPCLQLAESGNQSVTRFTH